MALIIIVTVCIVEVDIFTAQLFDIAVIIVYNFSAEKRGIFAS